MVGGHLHITHTDTVHDWTHRHRATAAARTQTGMRLSPAERSKRLSFTWQSALFTALVVLACVGGYGRHYQRAPSRLHRRPASWRPGSRSPGSRSRVTFWHVTDWHLNLFHNRHGDIADMCRTPTTDRRHWPASELGHFHCDPPRAMAERAVEEMCKSHPNPSFIVMGGDAFGHVPTDRESSSTIEQSQRALAAALRERFPQTKVLPMVGNHDTWPYFSLEGARGAQKVLGDIYGGVNGLSRSAASKLVHSGYYAQPLSSSGNELFAIVLEVFFFLNALFAIVLEVFFLSRTAQFLPVCHTSHSFYISPTFAILFSRRIRSHETLGCMQRSR